MANPVGASRGVPGGVDTANLPASSGPPPRVFANGIPYLVLDVDATDPRKLIVRRPNGTKCYYATRCDPALDRLFGQQRIRIITGDYAPLRFVPATERTA